MPTLDDARRAEQLAFIAGDAELEVGNAADLPWLAATLADLRGDESYVVARIDSGLTALVYRLTDGERNWALKQARPQALVRNDDGRTSFLNEVQRRAELEPLKRAPGGAERWQALADTCYASFRRGIIVSPWIDGAPVAAWDARCLTQVLDAACTLWTAGLFEWDLSAGNLLDDGTQVHLFDFGYLYPFDPRRQFNSAGNGSDCPQFHPAERFETRHFFGVLLDLVERDAAAALPAFRLEKTIALERYRRMRAEIAVQGAHAEVLEWIDGIMHRWAEALAHDLGPLFLAESWRSHALDLDDDLHGRSCTPMTLRRADWLLRAIDHDFEALRAYGALNPGDTAKTREELRADYTRKRDAAQRYQLAGTSAI